MNLSTKDVRVNRSIPQDNHSAVITPNRNARRLLAICAALLLFCIVAGASFASSFGVSGVRIFNLLSPKAQDQAANIEPTAATNKRPTIIIYSTPFGFDPQDINVKPGLHNVIIYNRSGLDNLQYSVTDQPTKKALLNTKAPVGANIVGQVTFTPGEVLLTEAGHPNWQCRIKVNQ